ncbi:tRNA1(Val) (adenine(37)-N6)-methyltransferase [Fictibacillus fluitans]|uniref:tRNA1(Val) (Adenine(37)-N6)-methyltransferase n=1 Tax=Fictibacillus fluitans TaxID=3058422 RepID=A0ABT8I331_9BACL|nr:tRNA1(Val) (adenine(37)-N6)-methyltransferase [Fictibacillus sp. NE201]MDN4527427.1 tRNA1(Val) (adenine(37)-N6)-methyltransferase [Fictibacillus sp. NE201]
MESRLQGDERLDYLVDESLKIIQSPSVFSFSLDAVLLSRFAYIPIQKGKIIDLCSGNGAVALLLTQRSNAQITGVEIQERLSDMARRSIVLNGLEDQVSMVTDNIVNVPEKLGHGRFDAVLCNPPYFPSANRKDHNENEHLAVARHEIYCTLEDVVSVSSKLVKQGGKVTFVHRPQRLMDILSTMRAYRLEPKRLQFIHPKKGSEANMLLIEGMKDGKPDLHILPPLTVYGEDGQYTEELKTVFYAK